MRLNNFIREAEEKEEKDPAIEDINRIVDTVKMAVSSSQMNGAVKQAAAMSKLYGGDWLSKLEKAMGEFIKQDTIDRFIEYTKDFSERLDHIK
jgi:hypothetical protein